MIVSWSSDDQICFFANNAAEERPPLGTRNCSANNILTQTLPLHTTVVFSREFKDWHLQRGNDF